METYNKSCEKCRKHRNYRIIIDSEIFYKGFYIRKHHPDGDMFNFTLCTRFAEGGDNAALDTLKNYVEAQMKLEYPPQHVYNTSISDCPCHPHEYTVAINGDGKEIWTFGEQTMKKSIDMLFGDQNEMQDMQ